MNDATPTPPTAQPGRTSYAERRKERIDALAAASVDEQPGVSLIHSAWLRLRRNPVFLLGLAITVVFVVLAQPQAVAVDSEIQIPVHPRVDAVREDRVGNTRDVPRELVATHNDVVDVWMIDTGWMRKDGDFIVFEDVLLDEHVAKCGVAPETDRSAGIVPERVADDRPRLEERYAGRHVLKDIVRECRTMRKGGVDLNRISCKVCEVIAID
jgi:hypothetical protein